VVQERGVGELHEVPEILDRAVPAAAVEFADEGGTVGRREHGGGAADVHGRPARVLVELARRGRLDQLAGEAAREPHALAFDLAAGLGEQLVRVRSLTEIDPDGLEDGVGVVLDRREALFVEDLERRRGPVMKGTFHDPCGACVRGSNSAGRGLLSRS
jgi:hypothetical protein